jgi:16S rRNA (cytosine1402-N4)-methyltransferase
MIAAAIGPTGTLIGIDRDPGALEAAREKLGTATRLVHGNFSDLAFLLKELGVGQVDGLLADLGASSPQFDRAERGFSFRQDGPLDMRMDPTQGETAASLVARTPERELADLIWRYGEERYSRRIARRLVEERRREPIRTTGRLAEIVRECVPKGPPWKSGGIDPATRTFQALRIATNRELEELEALLERLPPLVRPGGRVAIISFHSLEDRPVKQAFREREIWTPLVKKPVTADEAEIGANPRARSAKLRAAMRNASD